MSTEQWNRVSRLLDYVLQQPSSGVPGVSGEPEKPKRKPRKPKPSPKAEQLRMF